MANKKINLKYDGNKELLGNAELSVFLNKKKLSTHNIKEGFETYFSVTNSNFILDLVISLRLFSFIPISRKTELKINKLENSDYELLIYYDSFNGKFSKEYELTKIDLSNQNINQSNQAQLISEGNNISRENIKTNWKKNLVYIGLIFIFFKACFSIFNSDNNSKNFNQTCLNHSDLYGKYEVVISNNEFARMSGVAGIGDVELDLNKDGSFNIKIWTIKGDKIKLEKDGKWEIECDVENDYEKGEIINQKFTNKIFLEGFSRTQGGLEVVSSSRIKGYLSGGYPTLEKK